MNRDYIVELIRSRNTEIPEGVDVPDPDSIDMGSPASAITTTVDVREFTDHKRRAMRAHASQISEESFFLQMPDEMFREAFGYEWFIRRGPRPASHEDTLFT